MGFNGRLIAFDTSAAHCAAALVEGGQICIARTEPLERGQAERLIPFLEELLTEAGWRWSDLDGIVVGIGPGNFTGVRISTAAARGLALALGIPAMGLSMFELMLDPADPFATPDLLVSLSAPRDQAYVQPFRHGRAAGAARLIDPAAPPPDLMAAGFRPAEPLLSGPAPHNSAPTDPPPRAALPSDVTPAGPVAAGPVSPGPTTDARPRGMALSPVTIPVRGHRAAQIAAAFGAPADPVAITDLGISLGLHAAQRFGRIENPERPAPLYVRPADAAPPRDPPPRILPG